MTNHSPFPVISVEGDPYECGYQHGSQCKQLIEHALSVFRKLFKANLNLDWEQALEKGRKFASPIEEYDPASIEEMKGIAEGAGRAFDEILVLHITNELHRERLVAQAEGCTTIAATPEATISKHTLVGKNLDQKPATQELAVILKKKRNRGPNCVALTRAGLLTRDGFNSAGICVCANGLGSDRWRVGVPLEIVLNKVISAESLSDAISAIISAKRASSNNYMIGHSGGEAICIEAAPYDYNTIWADGGILAHSNHFTVANPNIKDLMPALLPNTLTRLHRATKLLIQERGNISVGVFKKILRDHFDKPFSICTHPDVRVAENLQFQTNASVIIDLNEKTMAVALGPPCENEYVTLTFEDIM